MSTRRNERVRHPTPRRTPASRRTPPSRRPAGRAPARRVGDPSSSTHLSLIAATAFIGLLVLLVVVKMLGGGGGAVAGGSDGGGGGAVRVGPDGSGYVDPNPPGRGTVTAALPDVVDGTRLRMNVVGLVDNPPRCTAASLHLGSDLRTVYHHACEGRAPGTDTYYFFVQLTNLTDRRVPVWLERFSVTKASGSAEAPLDEPPPTGTEIFMPTFTVLGPHTMVKGWITFDGTAGFTPTSLRYLDGQESLSVAFRGRWVSSNG